jgi:hypothetical protein
VQSQRHKAIRQRAPHREWLHSTFHEHDGWCIAVHWISDDGKAVPVRLELDSSWGDWDVGDFGSHELQPLSRAFVKALPVRRLVESSRLAAQRVLDGTSWRDIGGVIDVQFPGPDGRPVSAGDDYEPHEPDCTDRTALTASQPRTLDGKVRLVAQVYADEVANGNRSPARGTWERLSDAGMSARPGMPLTRERVRTWVREARRRGYLPPAPDERKAP